MTNLIYCRILIEVSNFETVAILREENGDNEVCFIFYDVKVIYMAIVHIYLSVTLFPRDMLSQSLNLCFCVWKQIHKKVFVNESK